ncbi:MAG: T9SS type A sorting domain-containing protein [Bacteroidia bacterium]|nr:T9SS type A sorting domain-containing protein [Bacteroidia bacterium]
MRKIYFFALAMLLGMGLNAQQKQEITNLKQVDADFSTLHSFSKTAGTIDTITDYLDRATAFYLLSSPNGYVLGTSDVSQQTGEHYDQLGASTTVTEVFVYFAHLEIIGTGSDTMSVHVWDASTDSLPSTLVASGDFLVSDADTSGFPTFITIDNPQAISASNGFVVTVEYGGGNLDDTLVVMSTNPVSSGGGPDGNGERRCVQYYGAAGAWSQAANVWTIGGQKFNADALIIPIVDYEPSVGVEPKLQDHGLSLFPAYPNPSASQVMVPFSVKNAGNVRLEIFNSVGKKVAEPVNTFMTAGDHEIAIDLNNLSNGKYFFILNTDNGALGGKFTVLK